VQPVGRWNFIHSHVSNRKLRRAEKAKNRHDTGAQGQRMSKQEELLAASLAARALPGIEMVREHRFHPSRKWRFDFAWPSIKLAVELDGRGRHQTVKGARDDCAKHNAAVLLGWRVLRYPATDIADVDSWVDEILAAMFDGA
jgi:very-short-patch-repair endonuclease